MPTNETQLILRLKGGDRTAFDEIYRMYSGRLYAFALQLSHCRHDAEDILQDAFVKLWVYREQITSRDSLKSLLFTIASNKLVNVYKSRLNVTLSDDMAATEECERADSSGDVSDEVEYRELESLVYAYIDDLPPTQRAVVRMSRFDRMTHQQIAARLGLSVQTVKNALSLGLKALRNRVGGRAAFELALFVLVNGTFQTLVCLIS